LTRGRPGEIGAEMPRPAGVVALRQDDGRDLMLGEKTIQHGMREA